MTVLSATINPQHTETSPGASGSVDRLHCCARMTQRDLVNNKNGNVIHNNEMELLQWECVSRNREVHSSYVAACLRKQKVNMAHGS